MAAQFFCQCRLGGRYKGLWAGEGWKGEERGERGSFQKMWEIRMFADCALLGQKESAKSPKHALKL